MPDNVTISDRVRELVDAAPPLTAEQRDRLIEQLRPVQQGRNQEVANVPA